MERGQIFRATFRPAPRWSPEIMQWNGLSGLWRASFIVDEGTLAGDWACIPIESRTGGLAWAPESELVDREDAR